MKPNETHDREILSALHDGELDGEARLFALRRLSHDTAWQDDCGRWQLIGDAMRRQAPVAAPSDFAARVRAALDDVPATLATAPPARAVVAPVRRPMRLWAGGALAASLALVGLYTLVPHGGTATAPAVAPVAAATPAPRDATGSTVPTSQPSPVSAPAVDTAPLSAPARIEVASAGRTPARATTVARAPRRASIGSPETAPAVAVATPAASAPIRAAAANPFHVPATDPLVPRPWPRAALVGGNAGLTASYGAPALTPRDPAPSFYPFEPHARGQAVESDLAP